MTVHSQLTVEGSPSTVSSSRMVRDIDRLTASTFDVLVVGGGIYGLTIAYDAAQRGLTVALIERADFGSGSSFNHLRTIHGGLRYLQTLDISRARESIRERRTLALIAPHAVHALPFVLPLRRSLSTGPLAMRAGFMLDQVLACDRNRGLSPRLRIPAGHVVSRREAIDRFPRLQQDGLASAAIWHDYVTPESDRLTFTWAVAAAEHGAVLANYVEALGLLRDGQRVLGVRAANQPGRPRDRDRRARHRQRDGRSRRSPSGRLAGVHRSPPHEGHEPRHTTRGWRGGSGRPLGIRASSLSRSLAQQGDFRHLGVDASVHRRTGRPGGDRDCRLHRRDQQGISVARHREGRCDAGAPRRSPCRHGQRPHRAAGSRTGSRPRGSRHHRDRQRRGGRNTRPPGPWRST